MADDDIIIPVWGVYSSNIMTWNMSSSITTWKLEGHPVLNSWDFTAHQLDFNPTTQRTNSLISSDEVFTIHAGAKESVRMEPSVLTVINDMGS